MKYLLSIFLTIIWLLCSVCLMLSVVMMYPLFAFTFLGILFFLTRKAALHHLMKVYERINTDKTFPEYLDEWQLINKEQS